MVYLFDGTYTGFLSVVFLTFERKDFDCSISNKEGFVASIFEEFEEVQSDEEKAKRVVQGIRKQCGQLVERDCYRVFLAEDHQTVNTLLRLIQRLFREGSQLIHHFGDSDVLYFHQQLRKVNRERHRMQAFIRFQKSTDGMYFSLIEPDFNVLPLLTSFFKNRYTDQSWLIYDVKRKYGFLYNQHSIEEVVLDEGVPDDMSQQASINLEEDERYYQTMWKQYFKSTNIVERKNMRLHLRHVPRRYWKYLTEKQS